MCVVRGRLLIIHPLCSTEILKMWIPRFIRQCYGRLWNSRSTSFVASVVGIVNDFTINYHFNTCCCGFSLICIRCNLMCFVAALLLSILCLEHPFCRMLRVMNLFLDSVITCIYVLLGVWFYDRFLRSIIAVTSCT